MSSNVPFPRHLGALCRAVAGASFELLNLRIQNSIQRQNVLDIRLAFVRTTLTLFTILGAANKGEYPAMHHDFSLSITDIWQKSHQK